MADDRTQMWSGTFFSNALKYDGLRALTSMNVAELAYEWADSDAKPELLTAAKAAAPVGPHFDIDGGSNPTYELRNSLTASRSLSDGTVRLQIRSNVPQASYVTKGTNPHGIYPTSMHLLSFFWEALGQAVSLPYVNHPGNQPNLFMQDVADQEVPTLRKSLVDFMNKRFHK